MGKVLQGKLEVVGTDTDSVRQQTSFLLFNVADVRIVDRELSEANAERSTSQSTGKTHLDLFGEKFSVKVEGGFCAEYMPASALILA